MLHRSSRAARYLRAALIIAGVAVSYFVTGRLIIVLGAPPNGAVTTVWLPSGITVAALVVFGPWAALGSFLGSLALDLRLHTPLPAALIVALANAGSEYLCYYLICCRGRCLDIVDKRHVARFAVAALIASVLSTVVGVNAYLVFNVVPSFLFVPISLTWFGSTLIGIVLIAPFLVYIFREWPALDTTFRRLEGATALAALAIASYQWQGPSFSRPAHEPLALVVILVLVWIAFRFAPAMMTAAVFSFAIASVAGAVVRLGGEPQTYAFVSIFSLQLLLGGLAMIGYLLASMVADQRRATEGLRLAAKVYDTVNEGLVVASLAGEIVDINQTFLKMTGYARGDIIGKGAHFMQTERYAPEYFAEIREAVTCAGEWHGELSFRRADTTPLPVWISISTVRDRGGNPTEYVAVISDITELREAQRKLVASARQAGMAEIAVNVLHNVGNVLNSVNVSAGHLMRQVRASRTPGLAKAVRLLEEHSGDLAHFLTLDEKGKLLPEYLKRLAESSASEQQSLLEELRRLIQSVDHIKDIVATQQSYAHPGTFIEQVQVRHLLEDALRINAEALDPHAVTVVKEYAEIPELMLDKARVMLILVNLIRNAKIALKGSPDRSRRLTLKVEVVDGVEERRLRICVADEGEGIPAENLARIFAHGFTTRQGGHGFGLHSCAVAAGEMGGKLTVRSDGPGKGATFTLEIPVS